MAEQLKPGLDIVLTHVDDRFDTGMKDSIGADAAAVLPLLDAHAFSFLIEDPATVWNLGPQRYPEIARRYAPLTSHREKLAIDINIVDRYQDVYPTKQQTGTELLELVHVASTAFPKVALYFENSIMKTDLPMLAASSAVVTAYSKEGQKVKLDSPRGVELFWKPRRRPHRQQALAVSFGESAAIASRTPYRRTRPASQRPDHYRPERRSAIRLSRRQAGRLCVLK